MVCKFVDYDYSCHNNLLYVNVKCEVTISCMNAVFIH